MMFVQLKIVRKKIIKCTLQGLIDADCGGSLCNRANVPVTLRQPIIHSLLKSVTSLEWSRIASSFLDLLEV